MFIESANFASVLVVIVIIVFFRICQFFRTPQLMFTELANFHGLYACTNVSFTRKSVNAEIKTLYL